jgi:glyoxylate reductase
MNVFVSCPLPGDAVERIGRDADVVVGDPGLGVRSPTFAEHAARFDAILALLTDVIDSALLDRARQVRLVANMAVGVDNIDLAACSARGIHVTNTPSVLNEATADLTFALLLAAARRVAEGDALVREGSFPGWSPTTLLGAPVFGTSLGIVGLGRIGQAVARRARGFGMRVFYSQRKRVDEHFEHALSATYVSTDELFHTCEHVTLHCPLTDETRHIASRARLLTMKVGSVLVNTARGPCVDEEALADVLERGPLAAAGIDVFEHEPAVSPRLRARRNVVLTPHIGSADSRTREAMARVAADNIIAFAKGAPLVSAVVTSPSQ